MSVPNTAILLMHCPDQQGLVSAVTSFLKDNNGNIIGLDQHVDPIENHFYMRVEWNLDSFQIPKEKMSEFFETLVAKKYDIKFRLRFRNEVPRVCLFVSKYAHCLFDILSRYEAKEWNIEIPLIISNHEKFSYVADRYNIPYFHIPITKENKEEQEARELELLKEHNIDFIVLARYMQILSERIISKYPNRIINIHHSSLPAFAGARPYESAFERGVKIMGATAHYVTADLDAGPIIYQDVIPISHTDSIRNLKRRGKDIEKIVLAKAIYAHMNHNVISYKNKTVVFGS